MKSPVSLLPLSAAHHSQALQQVYRATPGYWAMYDLAGPPAGQAARDIDAAAATPGRTMFGIVRRLVREEPASGVEMVGVVDLRLQWPSEEVVYLGMLMVAEAYQRQGIGTRAWQLLRPWLIKQTPVRRVRLGVEQFNPNALVFFKQLAFTLTGEASRVEVGDKLVRLLYMERELEERR